MRKLLTITLCCVAWPTLSFAASLSAPSTTAAGRASFETMAQANRTQGLDVAVPSAYQRPSSTVALLGSNYSLASASGRAAAPSGGLKSPVVVSNANPDAQTTFAQGASDKSNATTGTSEGSNASVTTPIPEPQSYALMVAGLVALAFMAARRGRV